jgi:hypothetical protein
MNYNFQFCNQNLWIKLASLKKEVDKKRKSALKKRITNNPYISNEEYILGAFIEMYEPHLKEIVKELLVKGYILDKSSGFGGKCFEYQTISGYFTIDYVLKNKIEKEGVKIRDGKYFKQLIFWPEKAELKDIIKKWREIVQILPKKKDVENNPIRSYSTEEFRRKYKLKDKTLQKQQLFENLRFNIWKKVNTNIKNRKARKILPDTVESCLGLFLEELETQVKDAVLNLYTKGYSIDKSGFTEDPQGQMIEGDFQLSDKTVKDLQKCGIEVVTNPSGYTKI